MHVKKVKKRKLVLFDIDGTLVINSHRSTNAWKQRLQKVFSDVYGIQNPIEVRVGNFNGLVDRQVFWHIAQDCGISRGVFLQNLQKAFDLFHQELKMAIDINLVAYEQIPDAVSLVKKLGKHEQFALGLVTGNIEKKNAWLKLKNAGIDTLFSFGGFSDSVDDRPALVKHAIELSRLHFKESFEPSQTVIIGDTIHDITAGKTVGAVTVAVASGITNS